MFVLSSLEETIRVDPKDLERPRVAAISSVVEKLLLDRVVRDLGLVITLYDILSIESGFVHPCDGGVKFKVRFRVVFFRPFPQEILEGKAKKATKEGLHVSLGFFKDVFVPNHYFPDPSFYNDEEGIWFWKYTDGDGEVNDMEIEFDEDVRIRVESVKYQTTPTPEELEQAREKDNQFGSAEAPFAPMVVIGKMNDEGLGPISWWNDEDEDDSDISSSEAENGNGDGGEE